MIYMVEPERKKLPCRYRNWTLYERAVICNGCGGKGGVFKPPQYMFTASCDHHDANYWLGGAEKDRQEADEQFYEAMKFDASFAPWWQRWWLYGAAWRYYSAVRFWGEKYFNYGKERTWEDLEEALANSATL